jgi:hypothetical protein
VIEGRDHAEPASPERVADATVEVLRAWPDELAGVAFLSGGQPPERATANLDAMQHHLAPWPLTFSFGRALVDPALRRGTATRPWSRPGRPRSPSASPPTRPRCGCEPGCSRPDPAGPDDACRPVVPFLLRSVPRRPSGAFSGTRSLRPRS